VVEAAPSAANEEMVLSDGDFIRENDGGSAGGGATLGFHENEIERESSYEAPVAGGESVSSAARRITVPIDLGKFPPSGKLKVTFEVRIELDEEAKNSLARTRTGSASF
jgi:hypothetical protein